MPESCGPSRATVMVVFEELVLGRMHRWLGLGTLSLTLSAAWMGAAGA